MPASEDMRYYETFYGIHTNDWDVNFAIFSSHNKLLIKDYISEAAACTETSQCTDTDLKFLYPQHIKKVYFIEGVIVGHITVGASGATSHITNYRVTVCKISGSEDTELFSTGWKTVNLDLVWDSTYSVGDERVLPFWIDAWEYEKLDENERIYIKIEFTADNNAVLWHSNDATWEDLKIEIPLRM
jgi:hypothetical protein